MATAKSAKRRSLSDVPTPNSRLNTSLRVSQKPEVCTICYSDAPSGQAVRLGCRHGWYCMHCMKMHADARLAVGDVCVPCPECREPIQDFCLKEFLSHDVIDGFHKRSVNQAIASSANLFTCPTPNCDMCVEVEEGDEPWLKKCPKCKKGSCLRCGAQPYHKGMSCQMYALRSRSSKLDHAEKSLRRWMRKTGTKQCPQCKMGVSKEDLKNQASQRSECHKMLCRHCGTQFCFKCLALLTRNYSCGCSIDAHGFVNPITGRAVVHIKQPTKGAAPKRAAGSADKARSRNSKAPVKKQAVRSKVRGSIHR